MSEQNKLILAILASFAFFYVIDSLNPKPTPTTVQAPQTTVSSDATVLQKASPVLQSESITGSLSREQALLQDGRVPLSTPLMQGSIRLKGALCDDVTLTTYQQTTDADSPPVALLSPEKTANPYFAALLYTSSLNKDDCPTETTLWTVDPSSPATLTPDTPIVLTATVGKAVYKRHITIDKGYVITFTDTITNKGQDPLNLVPLTTLIRTKRSEETSALLHIGGIGILNHKLSEVSFDTIKEKSLIQQQSTGGWHGFTDKYWLCAFIPDATEEVTAVYKTLSDDVFQTETVGKNRIVEKGQTLEVRHQLFTGAKVLSLLDGYEAKNHFDRFDLAVDFGWFYFLTKPLFFILETLNGFLNNIGLCIVVLTILLKLLMFPLAKKSHRSMERMRSLQPKMEKLKTLYAHDKMRLNQEIMNLYKSEKINPFSGFLPVLMQAPILFCLYKVLYVTIEMRHAPFIGWIHDLSAPDPTSLFNLFGLLPFTPPSFLQIGGWPIIMGLTMVIQQRMMPQQPQQDPAQAKMMLIMPLLVTYMFAAFPSGVIIYYAWSNILTILQQWYMMKKSS